MNNCPVSLRRRIERVGEGGGVWGGGGLSPQAVTPCPLREPTDSLTVESHVLKKKKPCQRCYSVTRPRCVGRVLRLIEEEEEEVDESDRQRS